MKILRVHSYYQQRGGEDAVFETESAILERHGHKVERLEFSNDDIPEQRNPLDSVKLAANAIWSRSSRGRIAEVAERLHPEVVHFDNTFPLISPSAYSTPEISGAAVVQTLHNFRLLCPNGLFFRDSHVCEDCLGKLIAYPSVIHGCYRRSREQTAVVSTMLTFHRLRHTWARDIDRFIALNPFSCRKFIEGGLPEDRIVVKPNFVDGPTAISNGPRQSGVITVGRLSEEKGIATLLGAWSRHGDLPSIEMIGDGPMIGDARAVADQQDHFKVLGRQPRETVMERLSIASALVFPSVCYENFPVAIAEAFSNGTPVIASRLGAMAEVVEDGITGLLFDPGNADDLAAKVRWAAEHSEEMRRMGENARCEYVAKYTPERNYEMLVQIYHGAIDHRRRDR